MSEKPTSARFLPACGVISDLLLRVAGGRYRLRTATIESTAQV